MRIYRDSSHAIGQTPLVYLKALTEGTSAQIVAKLEARNPAHSVKARICARMIQEAESKGILSRGQLKRRVIEAAHSGMALALAHVCAAGGYPLTLVMPEPVNETLQKIFNNLGADLLLTPRDLGLNGAIRKSEEILAADPEFYWRPSALKNPANPAIHERTTGPEIWRDTNGKLDALVAGIGSGGTITGSGRYLKSQNPEIRLVGVEPNESAVLTALWAGESPNIQPHPIEGIGLGFKPEVLDLDLLDDIERVTGPEAMAMTRRIRKEEGIYCGISSGAAMVAALRLAQKREMEGKLIVVIFPDGGEFSAF